MKARTIIEIIASLLILLFLYSAAAQVAFHPTFKLQINRSLVNTPLSSLVAWLMPVTQLLLVYLLWRRSTRLAGLSCSLAAVSCYTIYLIIMLPKAWASSCNCGELIQAATLEINILINLAIILMIATAIILAGRFKTNSPNFS